MKYFLSLLVLWLHSFSLFAAHTLRVVPFPSLSQLPVSAVHRIFQDSEGYMWYGTVNGLCRDDGYQVKIFRSDVNTPGLLNDNTIQCISESKDGFIWFGSDHGAYRLDKRQGTVTPLDSVRLQRQFIRNMYSTSDGNMWLSVGSELLRYDSSGAFQKSYPLRNMQGSPSWLAGFCESRQREVLITVGGGAIYRYDKENDAFSEYAVPPSGTVLTCIFQDNTHDYYWVGTQSEGLVLFNPSAERDSLFLFSPLPKNSMGMADGEILFAVQDDYEGWLWMTTRSDLIAMRYDSASRRLRPVDFRLPVSSNRMLNEIYKDRFGSLWVASFDEPSFIIRFSEDVFEEYALPALYRRTSFKPAVMALSDACERKMWVSQERTGLGLYDLNLDTVSFYFDFPELSGLPLWSVKHLSPSRRQGNVWVLPEYQSVAYELSRAGMTMNLHRMVLPRSLRPHEFFTQLYEDSEERLWIGTNNGLYLYDLKSQDWQVVNDTLGQVSAIQAGKNGLFWVGTTDKGVYSVAPCGPITHFPSPRSVTCLTVSEEGQVWVGTQEGGVFELSPSEGDWQEHTRSCGLDGDIVNQLVADVYGHLWIDTNQKLIEYNPSNPSFSSYLTTDGSLSLYRFIPTAVCQGYDGKIYFGGIPGILAVTPSDRLDQPSKGPVTLITGVQSQGEEQLISEQAVVLSPDEYDLEISFSSLDYLNVSKVRYAYRLLGLDEGWSITPEGVHTVFYKHLPRGRYTFEVKSTDPYGVWSREVTTLSIERLPAFYETGWAILFYVLLGATVIFLGVRFYVRMLKRRNEELYTDSQVLMQMRDYLKGEEPETSPVSVSDLEFAKLDDILLKKVLKVVEDNLSEPSFDVSLLAREVGMSRSSLTRKLKAITGLTPLEYIRRVKMTHARRLLSESGRSVSEVAEMLGYFNRKYFTSCFKEEFGVTPSHFQKQEREGVEMSQREDING